MLRNPIFYAFLAFSLFLCFFVGWQYQRTQAIELAQSLRDSAAVDQALIRHNPKPSPLRSANPSPSSSLQIPPIGVTNYLLKPLDTAFSSRLPLPQVPLVPVLTPSPIVQPQTSETPSALPQVSPVVLSALAQPETPRHYVDRTWLALMDCEKSLKRLYRKDPPLEDIKQRCQNLVLSQ